MDLRLAGKVIVVTGGSSGLGRSLCHQLVEYGAHVALCARNKSRLEDAEKSLQSQRPGSQVFAGSVDVMDLAALQNFVGNVVERFGQIDGVVNNAGRAASGAVLEIDEVAWQEDFQLKLNGARALLRFAKPHMQPGSSIVNVLAIGAKAPGPSSAPSSISRAAGMAMTKALSKDLGPTNIRVNAVLIGLIESTQWERQAKINNVTLQTFYEDLAKGAGIPLGRVGTGEEFANVVSFLLSEKSSYITGTAINIDGGLSPSA